MTSLKKLHRIQRPLSQHWVGDGFPVRTLLAYNSGLDELQSPFLLLAPMILPPVTGDVV